MNRKVAMGIMLTLLLLSMPTLTFSVSSRSVLTVEQTSIGPGTLPDWHEDAQVKLGWVFDDPTNPQNSDPLPGWNISIYIMLPAWDYDPGRIVWDQPGQWHIRIPNLDNDRPVKHFWISWVYDFDTYLPGLRSATSIDWFPDDGSGNFQYSEEWFDSDGNLTTNFMEAVYARATLSVNLYPNPQYEDIWLGTYGLLALAREVYILTLCPLTPTEVFFNLNPNPASVGQTVTLLGNLTTVGSSPIGGATVTIKVNGSPVGTLTTNSTGWFKAAAAVPSTGDYTVRVEYAGSAEYLPSFDEHLLVVETGLSITIYTDKDTYHAGDTMHLGLNVSNAGIAIVVDFKIWIALPSGGDYTYQNVPSVTIPSGLEYSNPNFDMITLPSIPPGNYTWHAAFLDPTTHTIIVEDTAEWEFV